MSEEYYSAPVDFSDITQMTVYRCEGVQQAMRDTIEELSARADVASDGVILGFWSDHDLSEEQLNAMSERLRQGFEAYARTK